MTPAPLDKTRLYILRFYWDGETEPSVEVPLGDFFACGWGKYCQINSLPVCVNPGSAFNCYWIMPFRKKAKITLENLDDKDMTLYYQINYTLTDVPADAAYFHAQFRRVPKLPAKSVYTILDGVRGRGQYVGTYLAWEVHSPGWWGEGRDQVLPGRRPASFPRSAAPARRTTSAAPTTSRTTRPTATRRSARPTPAWPRCCRRT